MLKRQTREFEWAALNPDRSKTGDAPKWTARLRPDGSWPDVNYADQSRGFWKTSAHLARVQAMAVRYAEEKAAGAADAPLKAATLAAAHYWIEHDFRNSNWWQNEIGVPRYIATILLLMEDEISPEDRAAGLKIAARATISMTGQNLVWMTGIVFRRALIEGNMDLARQARDVIAEEVKIAPHIQGAAPDTEPAGEEGLQSDHSFHQHGPQQQFGNYGLAFAGDLTEWAWKWRDTPLALPEAKLALLRDYYLRGLAAVTVNGTMDISACGRQLFPGSPASKGMRVLALLAAMADVDLAHAEEYRAAARQASQPGGAGATGLTDYFRSDYIVCRRPGFYASVKLCSHRVIGTEATNAENVSGRYLADGALFLYQTGREFTDIFPVWDWRRVPGVTCATTGTTLAPAGWMGTDYAGGVTDGVCGAAGMENHRDGVDGRKGWFFFDEGVVCLGAGITGTTGPVRTSIDQRLAEGETKSSEGPISLEPQLHSGLRWVLHGKEGYLFPEPQDVWAGTQQQRGSWKNVYASGSATEIGRDVFSIWIDHPAESGSYAYMLVPDASVQKLEGYVAHSPIEVLSNTPKLQAARSNISGVTEILFFEAGKLDAENLSIAADHPCAVIIRSGTTFVSDPTQKGQELTLTINGKALPVKLPQGQMAGGSAQAGKG